MGSQANWHALHEAPAAIVVAIGGGRFRIARPYQAIQPDRRHGGVGPVVVTYGFDPGKPYETEAQAGTDAALILARQPVGPAQ